MTHSPLRDGSRRLMSLLRGGTTDRPPYWEPWFAKGEMLEQRYGGDYLAMADDLGHAAIPVGSIDIGAHFAKRVEQAGSPMWYGGGSIENIARFEDAPEPDWDAVAEQFAAGRQRARDAGIACWMVLGWCFHRAATSIGLEDFSYALVDQPELLKCFMAWIEQRNATAIERVIAPLQPDWVLYDGDCAYKTGTMIDPASMRELTYEPTRPNIERLGELGIPATFHSDGKLDDVIPLIEDLGFVAVHGCERQANDLDHLVETFGRSIVLCGNMDVVFLSNATAEQIAQRTADMLETGNRYGRFIAGCNTSPQDYIPDDNYIAFVRAVTA